MRRHLVIFKRMQRNIITLRQLFNEWLPIHSRSVSKSAIKSYHIAFKHISNIADMPITDIHFQHLQNVINSMHVKGLSYSSCKKVRTLLNQLFNYAIIQDYPITNYALHLNLGPNVPTIRRRVFTRQQINCKHTIHDTRHTFASLLDAVASPNALRSLLGHKQGDITTRVYTHKTIRELRKTIELLK